MNNHVTDTIHPSRDSAREHDEVIGAFLDRKYIGIKKVLIASPHRKKEDRMVTNLKRLMMSPTIMTMPYEPYGMTIAAARTDCIRWARAGGYSHIFFIDDDVIIPCDALIKLAAHDTGIVSGFYCYKRKPIESFARRYAPDPSNKSASVVVPVRIEDFTIGDVIHNTALGTGGCSLINLEVFDKIEEPWFRTTHIKGTPDEGSMFIAEDEYFGQKAHMAGFNMILDTGVQCIHVDIHTRIRYGHPGVIDMDRQTIINPQGFCLTGISMGRYGRYFNGRRQ